MVRPISAIRVLLAVFGLCTVTVRAQAAAGGSHAASTRPLAVTILVEPGGNRVGDLLSEELRLMGIPSSQRRIDRSSLETARERADGAAVVWLGKDGEVAIWHLGERRAEPDLTLEPSSESPSSEKLALILSEWLRGRLLPVADGEAPETATPGDAARSGQRPSADPANAPSTDAASDGAIEEAPQGGSRSRSLSFDFGPTMLLDPTRTVAPAISAAFSTRPGARARLGGFLISSFPAARLEVETTPLSVFHLWIGSGLGLKLVDLPGSKGTFDLVGSVAWRMLTFSSETGPPADRTIGTSHGLALGLGLEVSCEVAPWFHVAASTTPALALPLFHSGDSSDPPGQRPGLAELAPLNAELDWVTALLARVRF